MRVPDGVDFVVKSRHGDVHVTTFVATRSVDRCTGNVQAMLPGYAQVRRRRRQRIGHDGRVGLAGNAALFDAARQHRTVDYLRPRRSSVRLHTDDGTLFTDFPLRGTSREPSETIDGSVNGGDRAAIDVETRRPIRLLRLQPQA